MTEPQTLQWPATAPTQGRVVLRPILTSDVHVAMELSRDPYVPLIGTLPATADEQQATDWITRQHGRLAEGTGFSFAVALADTDRPVGFIGLWLAALRHGRATAGYAIAPAERRRGLATAALRALASFAWSIPALHRIELHIEPWNLASTKTATSAGFQREGLLRRHTEIGGERRDMVLYAAIRDDGTRDVREFA